MFNKVKHIATTISFAGFGVILAACSNFSIPTESNYNAAANSWDGSSLTQLMQVWGLPSKHVVNDDGSSVYEYLKSDVKTVPGYTQPGQIVPAGAAGAVTETYYPGYSTNANTYADFCRTSFQVNPQNMITKVTIEGNHCVANDAKYLAMKKPYTG